MLPWVSIYGNLEGNYKVCCYSEPTQGEDVILGNHTQPLSQVWNNDKYRELRRKFLAGEKPTQCLECCYNKEATGSDSPRTRLNLKYMDFINRILETNKDGSLDAMPIYFDVRFGNICNFKCRMCGPWASTSWLQELKNKNIDAFSPPDKWTNSNVLWDDLPNIIPFVEEIYFAGGEPMLQKGHFKLLDWLIEHDYTNIDLSYNTNLSGQIYKNLDIDKYWSHFKGINLWPSCEGTKDVGSYIRTGFDWDIFTENILKYKRHVKTINTVACIYNIYNIPLFINWCESNGFTLSFNTLTNPTYLSIQVFDKEEKLKVLAYYRDIMKNKEVTERYKPQIVNMLKFMMGEDNSKLASNFKSNTKLLDSWRNTNFITTVPELKDWYERI